MKYGDDQVLSTAVSIPFLVQMPAIVEISAILRQGLEGDSIQTSLVLGLRAFRCLSNLPYPQL